jgi:hypothetical protein
MVPTNFARPHTGPKNPLSHKRLIAVCEAYQALYEEFLAQGGQVNARIFEATLTIQNEVAHWRTRSASLDYQARKQAERRGNRRERTSEPNAAYDYKQDLFVGEETTTVPIIPDATREAIARFRRGERSERDEEENRPDTSEYKKSGLV